MRRLLVLMALLAVLPGVVGAAEYNAASCSRGDVYAAYQKCSSGDTVIIPPGSCTWTSGIITDKSVSFKGAGKDSTVIYGTFGTASSQPTDSSTFFAIYADSTSLIQVSGMTLRSDGTTSGIKLFSDPETFRITGMRFDKIAHGIWVMGRVGVNGQGGVIDHCDFLNFRNNAIKHIGDCKGAWIRQTPLGTKEAVYIEDCNFIRDQDVFGPNYPGLGNMHITASNSGSRYVVRYVTFQNDYDGANPLILYSGSLWDAHGYCYDGGNCGGQDRNYGSYSLELYKITGYVEHAWADVSARGGKFMIFDNAYTGHTMTYAGNIRLMNYRSWKSDCQVEHTLCENAEGYPCKDQVNDAYFWNNTINSAQFSAVVDNAQARNHIKPNRDYWDYTASFTGVSGVGMGTRADRPSTCTTGVAYWSTDQGEWDSTHSGPDGALDRCTSTNTWTSAWYTPYQYPHPLALGASPQLTCQNQGYQCCDSCDSGPYPEYDGDCSGQLCCDSCGAAVRELVLDLKMDEGSGTQASDSSGHGNDGTVSGASWTEGRIGSHALSFDGTGSYVEVGDSDSLDPGYLTVSMWLNADALADNAGLIAKGDASHRQYWAWIYQGSLSLEIDEGGLQNGVYPLDTGAWHHLAFTYDGSSITTYIDGEEVSGIPQATGPILDDDDPLIIGALPGFGHFAGSIDDVRVYSYALTSQEIRGIYMGTEGLVLHLPMDEGSGSAAMDSSGHGNDGTVSGASWTEGRIGSHALRFDGTGSYVEVGDSDSLDITDEITLAAWVYPEDVSGYSYMVTKPHSSAASPWLMYALRTYSSTDKFSFSLTSGGTQHTILASAPANTGQWYHVAGTYSISTKEMRIYVNGSLSNSETVDAGRIDTNSQPLQIGKQGLEATTMFNGTIDDIRVYSRALSPEEIQALASPHRADTSGDGCVDSQELTDFIDHWYLDSTAYPMGELMEAVGLWKSGCS